ncbi:MAG: tetratricopeptide repeat protein [Polyangia bacterium]
MIRGGSALVLAILLSSHVVAFGADTNTPLVELDRGLARAHFERGRALFERDDYAQALTEFRAALALVPAPALEYNVGLCLERTSALTEAVAAYQRFLDARPDDPAAPAVRARVEALRSGIAAVAAHRDERVLAAARPSVVAPAVVGGAALGLAIIGAGLFGHAKVEADSLRSGCCAESEISPLRGQAYAGYALLAAAGVTAVVDVALWVRWSRARRVQKSVTR